MFAPHDHLPLDRIITRFSSPTTITQFQRSSLDGILIELARLVPHGANDNIFCLSGPAKSAGGEGGRAPPTPGEVVPHRLIRIFQPLVLQQWKETSVAHQNQ